MARQSEKELPLLSSSRILCITSLSPGFSPSSERVSRLRSRGNPALRRVASSRVKLATSRVLTLLREMLKSSLDGSPSRTKGVSTRMG